MKVKGITERQLRSIVRKVGVQFNNGPTKIGNYLFFTLRLPQFARAPKAKYRRTGTRGRRICAVCYHGHFAVMQRILDVNPDAVIRSAVATYLGKDDFEAKAPSVGERNVGSMMEPRMFIDSCNCGGTFDMMLREVKPATKEKTP